jgi:hypothetical protein
MRMPPLSAEGASVDDEVGLAVRNTVKPRLVKYDERLRLTILRTV